MHPPGEDASQSAVPKPSDVAAYILSGGASQRMGQPKALLMLDGTPLVEFIAARIRPYVSDVHAVVKEAVGDEKPEPWAARLPRLVDATPERALVHGIRAALHAPGPKWRWLLACDMPDVGPQVLAALWVAANASGKPGAYPITQRGLEPLPSLWRADVIPAPDWGMAAHQWLRHAGLAPWHVPPQSDAEWLCNVNTPEEWRNYLRSRDQRRQQGEA